MSWCRECQHGHRPICGETWICPCCGVYLAPAQEDLDLHKDKLPSGNSKVVTMEAIDEVEPIPVITTEEIDKAEKNYISARDVIKEPLVKPKKKRKYTKRKKKA